MVCLAGGWRGEERRTIPELQKQNVYKDPVDEVRPRGYYLPSANRKSDPARKSSYWLKCKYIMPLGPLSLPQLMKMSDTPNM
jgi:hypothetical protein